MQARPATGGDERRPMPRRQRRAKKGFDIQAAPPQVNAPGGFLDPPGPCLYVHRRLDEFTTELRSNRRAKPATWPRREQAGEGRVVIYR